MLSAGLILATVGTVYLHMLPEPGSMGPQSRVEKTSAACDAFILLTAGLDLTSAKMATVNGQPVQGQQPSQAEQISPSSAPNAAANVHAASNAYAILGASTACMQRPLGRPRPSA